MKKAFTLAEVLITLAIIGVIAAITIPSIVANHQKTALEAQFAKSYRTLSAAVNLAIAEHGAISTWDWHENRTYTNEEKDAFVKKYFLPYLNVVKFCPSDNSIEGCAIEEAYYGFNGGNYGFNYAKSNYPKVILADGSFLAFVFPAKGRTQDFGLDIDINGHKKPNAIGRDLFSFNIFKETDSFYPYGIINNDVPFNKETQSYTYRTKEEIDWECNGYGGSWNCTAKVVQDGFKMNY